MQIKKKNKMLKIYEESKQSICIVSCKDDYPHSENVKEIFVFQSSDKVSLPKKSLEGTKAIIHMRLNNMNALSQANAFKDELVSKFKLNDSFFVEIALDSSVETFKSYLITF